MQLAVVGRPTQQVWFEEVPLWEIAPEAWWENEPGLMAIYPLCRHREAPRDSILHAVERIEATESDVVRRAHLLTSLGALSQLVYPTIDLTALIGREKMKKFRFYQEILDEGAIHGSRCALMSVIETRFGKRPAANLKKRVDQIDDRERLDELLRFAAGAKNIDALREEIER